MRRFKTSNLFLIFLRLLLLLLFLAGEANSVHERLSPRELHHIFGTKRKEDVPEYWLEKPRLSAGTDGYLLTLRVAGDEHVFQLTNKSHLLAAGFHVVDRSEDSSTLAFGSELSNCIFEGRSLTNANTHIALVWCGEDMRGLVVSPAGHFLVHPNPKGDNHIVHKRSLPDFGHTCSFNPKDDPFPEDRLLLSPSIRRRNPPFVQRLAVKKEEDLTIELAVFADDIMWRHFERLYGKRADAEMHKFILATVNNIDVLYGQHSIEPKIRIIITRYEIMKKSPPQLHSSQHLHGDVDRLLDNFCDFQHSLNPTNDNDPRHWDHALLFSGYDLYRDGERTVAGYAPVKGMCSGPRSCTINEGLDFGSVFVVTHEMGHSLGMYHDGDNECDLRCCIMSPSVGSGKTQWSSCSVKELNFFVQKLGTENRADNCLRDRVERDSELFDDEAPGQKFPLDEQCAVFHGQCWRHELRDGQPLEDVCKMVWCGNGEGIVRTAHPALEGTYCSPGKWCESGACVASQTVVSKKVDGEWGEWKDNGCNLNCEECVIQGQLKTRRSIRRCNNPRFETLLDWKFSPNNGGRQCEGADSRGIICEKEICSGATVEEFATAACTKIRDSPDTPNPQLSGDGLQFEQAPCKIWCQLAFSNNIRTISNFPDGTPCGENKYCVKGECRRLSCNGTAVVDSDGECPENDKPEKTDEFSSSRKLNDSKSPTRLYAPSIRRTTSAATEKPSATTTETIRNLESSTTTAAIPTSSTAGSFAPLSWAWSLWSPWSGCETSTCWGRGLRVRHRTCMRGICPGPMRQRSICRNECPDKQSSEESSWGEWTACSVSCGPGGLRVRRKPHCSQECVQREVCESVDCAAASNSTTSGWSQWTSWTPCSPCGGKRRRRRFCSPEHRCEGPSREAQQCTPTRKDCPSTAFSEDGWEEWTNWTPCSVTCGEGLKTRKRVCPKGVTCKEKKSPYSASGSTVETASCLRKACSDSVDTNDVKLSEEELNSYWSNWGPWSSCSVSCGKGFIRRTRKCLSEGKCKGKAATRRHCTVGNC